MLYEQSRNRREGRKEGEGEEEGGGGRGKREGEREIFRNPTVVQRNPSNSIEILMVVKWVGF